jgi:hypothetical protein
MAGAGYKLFATGDVLTAAQVNTYLMQQSVMAFASSTARNTALSGVVSEGMVAYLLDTNDLTIYDGAAWNSFGAGDITGVTAGTGLSGGGTSGAVTVSIDSTVATLTGSQTLTNKTLTTPIISSISNSGTVTIPTGTDTLVNLAGTQTLTNKTLTAPAINNATDTNSLFITPEERTTVTATAATGTVNYDALTQGVLYYTTNASANFTLNFRGSGATTLSSMLAVGDALSLVFLNTNGSTAYYPTAFQIDGSSVTPKWSGGTAPAAGNASAIDAYSFTIIKTAATPTYVVLAGGATKFA